MFLSVFTVWMEKVASVNCVWAWMGVWGRGGEMGRGQNGPLPLWRYITITVPGAQKIAKKNVSWD